MVIEAYISGRPFTDAALIGARKAISLLEELAKYIDEAKKMLPVNASNCCPKVLLKMIRSVELLEESNYTPMAAVAGAFSDLVKDEVIKYGAKTVIVNNGGDIAIEIEKGESLNIGIIGDLSTQACNHIFKLTPESNIKGIATSGFGGRSLSKGVANAVTVFALDCSTADAAATSIANATDCISKKIIRCKAEELDYQSDLKGFWVTRHVGILDEDSKINAINNGLQRAKQLYKQKIIYGSVIYLQNHVGVWPNNIQKSLY